MGKTRNKKLKTAKPIKSIRNRTQRRMIFTFSIISLLFVVVAIRIGYITVIANEVYASRAVERQTKDEVIQPHRGAVLDRNMTELAASLVSYRVWLRPGNIAGKVESEGEKSANIERAVKMLSEELDMNPDDVRSLVSREKVLVRAAKDVKKDVMERIRQRCKDEKINGVEMERDVTRIYPYGTFASHIIGTVNDDGHGRSGIELQYDKTLTGMAGRWVKNTDATGNTLAYGKETRFAERNGLNVILTIDEAIQHYLEKTMVETVEKTGAKRVMAIVMDPKTGDVLGMGMYPDYDLNDPKTPLDPLQAEYAASLEGDEQMKYWNQMWRNPMISDIYDPGSTFKLITVAAALEERATSPDEGGFRCSGVYPIGKNSSIRCWRYYNPHGLETVKQAVGNSCNPVMVQLVQRMGWDKFYKYIELFGFTGHTGIDYPGEGASLVQSKKQAGQLGLANMAFGQGISVTPIQLITAVSAIGNNGNFMQPRFMKALADDEGRIVEENKPVVLRQVVSRETAAEVMDIMEYTVNNNIKGAKIPGYRIGGKSGTAEKLVDGSYKNGKVVASLMLMAPMEDPQVSVLYIVDEPDPAMGDIHGTTAAAPGAKALMSEALRYLNIPPNYTEEETEQLHKKYISVPELTGMSYSDASATILGYGLNCVASPAQKEYEDFIVKSQYPEAGEMVPPGGQVCVYRE
ncbi:stage V sporulation protein D [Clostridia bacterium]|nr:stage V sporulation protein D [Clostridia bacterium]